MCMTCHEAPGLNPAETVYPDSFTLAELHGDEIAACIRGMVMADGSVVNYCVDCGSVVEGTDHNCYD